MIRTPSFGWAALGSAIVVIFVSCGFPEYGGFVDTTETDGTGGAGTGGAGTGGSGAGAGADAGCTGTSCPDGGACDPVTHTCLECLLPAHPCPEGMYCDATHQCQPGCNNDADCMQQTCIAHVCTGECGQGMTQCVATELQGCDPTGNWQSQTTCTGSTPVCSPTGCVECAEGASRCLANSSQPCASGGTWGTPNACMNQTCVSGACVGVCTTGQMRCSGNGVETCDAAGQWGVAVPCMDICAAGACAGTCNPGAQQCAGNAVETCASGATWGSPMACASSTCIAGTCSGVCVAGTTQCSGNGVEMCAPTGQWSAPAPCMNQACVSGACTGVCAPGAVQCSGNAVETCSNSGAWGAPAPCTSGLCIGGVCSTMEVEYQNEHSSTMTTAIGSQLWVLNNGTTSVDLTGMTLRYYLTIAGEVPIGDLVSNVNWAHTAPIAGGAQSQWSGISIAAVAISPVPNADAYIEFTLGSTMLPAGYELQFSWTTQDFNALNFNQSNDYSFNASDTSETPWSNVVLLQNGNVLWGVVP